MSDGTLSPLSDSMWDELIKKYKQGNVTIKSLAEEYHIDPATIRKKFIKCGVDIVLHPNKFDEQKTREMADDFKSGVPISKIAKKFDTDRGTIYEYLDKLGVRKIERQSPKEKKEKISQDIDELFSGAISEETIQKLLSVIDGELEARLEDCHNDIMLLFSEMVRKGLEEGKITISLPENRILAKESERITNMLTANNKLTKEQVEEIIKERKSGIAWKKIAIKYGVSIPTIKYHCRKPAKKVEQIGTKEQLSITVTQPTVEELPVAEAKKEIEAVLEKE